MYFDLTYKYDRKNFFGDREWTEDWKQYADYEDLKKAFRAFRADYDSAINLNSAVIYWDSLTDYEKEIVTVRTPDTWGGIDINKYSFSALKRKYYSVAEKAA